jgi:hypothetical protein
MKTTITIKNDVGEFELYCFEDYTSESEEEDHGEHQVDSEQESFENDYMQRKDSY